LKYLIFAKIIFYMKKSSKKAFISSIKL